jgi:phosphopantothenoylcysteine decarboxylase/phosphopantothenate--cysteine ligase
MGFLEVETAEDLHHATLSELDRADVLLMSAAVADYRPAEPVAGKIEKEGRSGFALDLVRTDDVLTEVARRRRSDQVIVGFAAEHGREALDRARAKLERKQLDAIVVNDVSRPGIGFDAEENEVTILTGAGATDVSRRGKDGVAAEILDRVQELRAGRGGEAPVDGVGRETAPHSDARRGGAPGSGPKA